MLKETDRVFGSDQVLNFVLHILKSLCWTTMKKTIYKSFSTDELVKNLFV